MAILDIGAQAARAKSTGAYPDWVFADRAREMKRSAIRELLKVTAQPDIISFAGGLPAAELFPLERVGQAFQCVLEKVGARSLQYSETEGIAPLREWIAASLRTPGRHISRDNIFITSGAQQALDLIGRIFLDPGDRVIVENPTYLALLSAWRPLGVEFLGAGSDSEGMQVEELEPLLERQPKLLYLVPDFQNPQGTTLSLRRRKLLLELSSRYRVPIVEDNAYGQLRYSGEALPHLLHLAGAESAWAAEHIIHVGTFSKVLMPGLRVGWVVAPEPVIEKLVAAKQAADLHTSTLNQHIALELLNANYLQEIVPRLRDEYRKRRDAMLEALAHHFTSDARWTRPDGGMFAFMTLPNHMNATTLLSAALDKKVAYVPGEEFHLNGQGKNTVRLNFSNASPEKIAEGIARLSLIFGERSK